MLHLYIYCSYTVNIMSRGHVGHEDKKSVSGYTDRRFNVVVDPTPPTCCQQSPAPESCGSQQSLPPGGKERLHFVGIRPEVQARKGGW